MKNIELNKLIENAFDFFEHSLDEFEDNPKYSVIHFYTAVELFLKARLMAEHWSLVILKDPDWKKFHRGEFVSVSLQEAADRLERVVRSGLNSEELKCFKRIANHRNRIMHFFHEVISDKAKKDLLLEIAREQVTAWYFLRELLFVRWKNIFHKMSGNIYRINQKLIRHHEYLNIVYENRQSQIDQFLKNGSVIKLCPYCGYKSHVIENEIADLKVGSCLVCEQKGTELSIICPDCENSVTFVNEGRGECIECKRSFEPEDLVSLLTKDIRGDKDYFESGLPAHCTYCDGYETVIEYSGALLYLNCFEIFKEYEMDQCDWCGHKNAGKLEDSFLTGCPGCYGRFG